MKKIKVAILDDYQNVTHHFANWETLNDKIELKMFNEYMLSYQVRAYRSFLITSNRNL